MAHVITLQEAPPFEFDPRTYQREVFDAYRAGARRFITVWHRRSGKDKMWVNFMILRALERVGNYYYVLDTRKHAKDIIWTGVAGEPPGPFLFKHIPREIIKSKNETDLSITLKNGSVIQLYGSDQVSNLRGTNAVGVVFSEYSLHKSEAWPTFEPQIIETKGWAAFNFTPRGSQNHATKAYNRALKEQENGNRTWFVSKKTVYETHRDAPAEDGSPIFSDTELNELRRSGRPEDFIQQEYFCAFSGSTLGSYYGAALSDMQQEGRICDLPRQPDLRVFTVWDLGVKDATAIIWAQWCGEYLHIIDYQEFIGVGLVDSVKAVLAKPYAYSMHYMPHDVTARELTTGKTRIDFVRSMTENVRAVEKLSVIDGVDRVRRMLYRVKIDKSRCARLIDALEQYHKAPVDPIDPEAGYKEDSPVHDWSSHGADAARYLAVVYEDELTWRQSVPLTSYDCSDDPFDNPLDAEDEIW